MFLGDIVDKLLDEHGLAHTCAAEKADFSAFEIRFKKVNNLYASEEHLLGGFKVFEFRGFPVDRKTAVGIECSQTVNGISGNIQHATPDAGAHGHFNRFSGGDCFHTSAESVCGVHRNTAYSVFSDMLLHLDN